MPKGKQIKMTYAEEIMKLEMISINNAIECIKSGKYNLSHVLAYCEISINLIIWATKTEIKAIRSGVPSPSRWK